MIQHIINLMNHNKTWQPHLATLAGTLFVFCMLTTCVNNIGDGLEADTEGEPGSGTLPALNDLNINTRTQDIGTTPTLPIHIYAFDSKGTCAAQQTLTTADADIVLQLPAGSYTIYALAGATDLRYQLPDASAATAEHIIMLQDGHTTHGELEAGAATITLEDERTTDLTITLTRIVAQVTAAFSQLPTDVTAVSIALEPLAQQLKLNGTYGTLVGPTTFALTQDSDGQWITAEPVYLLPSQENITVSITLTKAGGDTHTYAYNSNIRLTANYKHSLQATYTESHGPDINGSLQSTDWAGEQEINFDFGPGGTSGNDNTEPVTNLPAVGTLYQGCYVLAVTDATATSANLLLVAPKEWTDLTKDDAESTISTYTTGTLDEWALPTRSQAEMIYHARTKIQDMNQAADFLFNDGGILKVFWTDDMSFSPTAAYTKTPYHARVVKVQAVTIIN